VDLAFQKKKTYETDLLIIDILGKESPVGIGVSDSMGIGRKLE
jgi:hypothetical protein